MYEKINTIHKVAHSQLEVASGGVTRYKRGALVEGIIQMVWESLGGTVKKVKFPCVRGDKTCKMGLDAVLYKDEVIKAHVECKSYLDLCYLERAEWNSREMFENSITEPKIILALENSIAETSKDYVLEGNYIDEIFFLCQGKRSSTRPLYKKESFKDIDTEYFSIFYKYLQNLIKS